MSRRAIHIEGRSAIGRAIAGLVASRRPAAPKFVMSCIGCGCTDGHPCPGGCYWSRPGICSRCAVAPETELLRSTRRVEAMFTVAAVQAMKSLRWTFRMPSVAVLAWDGSEESIATDRERRGEGALLDATTTVRICRDGCWRTKLVYRRAASPEDKLAHRWTYHLSFRMHAPLRQRPRRRR